MSQFTPLYSEECRWKKKHILIKYRIIIWFLDDYYAELINSIAIFIIRLLSTLTFSWSLLFI